MSLLARICFRLRWWWWFWVECSNIGQFYANRLPPSVCSANWRRAQREWMEREPKP